MRLRREEKGSTAVLVALTVTALVGLAALAVDAGQLYMARTRLMTAADYAAMAGARDLPDPAAARAAAQQYAAANGVAAGAQVTVSDDRSTVTVTLQETVPLTFARVLGIRESQVTATAAATSAALSGVRGVVPLVVVRQNFQYGQQVTLKANSQNRPEDAPGNYQAVALGGTGASNYRDNLEHGYTGWIRIGDWIPTEPGNMAGPTRTGVRARIDQDPHSTYENVQAGSSRLLTVPVVDSFQVNGRGEVQVVGFAVFFLEDSQGGGQSGAQITGRFLRYVLEGEANGDAPDFGARDVKLIR
jgi:Flp pilus assembly protein TadG